MPGEDVKFANPPEAGTTYSDYVRTTHLGTSAGAGLPYETHAGDIRNVSDRTLRVVIQEFRRFVQQRQWHVVIPMLCQTPMQWWADACVLGGLIPLSERDAAASPEWSPHGWEYIHPTQDAQAEQMQLDMGTQSRSALIRKRGDDPRMVLAQRKADKQAEDKAGLAPPPAPTPAPGQPQRTQQ